MVERSLIRWKTSIIKKRRKSSKERDDIYVQTTVHIAYEESNTCQLRGEKTEQLRDVNPSPLTSWMYPIFDYL
jgi:hypothetical protein